MNLLESVTNRGATPALISTLAFTESRHRVLADNIANWQTPGYRSRQLSLRSFQRALGEALKEKGNDPYRQLMIDGGEEFGTNRDGTLRVNPGTEPGQNLVFHDGTNASIERMMSDLAQNSMLHETATTLLKGRFDGLRKAIRGTV